MQNVRSNCFRYLIPLILTNGAKIFCVASKPTKVTKYIVWLLYVMINYAPQNLKFGGWFQLDYLQILPWRGLEFIEPGEQLIECGKQSE